MGENVLSLHSVITRKFPAIFNSLYIPRIRALLHTCSKLNPKNKSGIKPNNCNVALTYSFLILSKKKSKNTKENLKEIKSIIFHPWHYLRCSRNRRIFFKREKSDDIPKGRVFTRRKLLSMHYYACRRYHPPEAYAGQACPRPSFARSFAVVHVFMHFQPVAASWLDSTHIHVRSWTSAIVRQTIYMYCSSMMYRERWPSEGQERTKAHKTLNCF